MTVLGIDLGTTNSACAIWKEGKSQLIPNRLGSFLTPSVVGIQDDQIVVGETAKCRLISHPKETVAVFKRAMGSEKTFKLAKRAFSAVELSAMILRSLKEDAQTYLGEEVTQAVISVPAYFNDAQRKATKQAGELAGLVVERLINEPTAAAMVYGLHEQEDDVQFMVLDMGGGTFDVSLVEFFSGVIEVHASAGDNYLGGEDFTTAVMQRFLKDQSINHDSLSPSQQQHLYRIMDQAKHHLGQEPKVVLENVLPQQKAPWQISREDFENIAKPLLQRMQQPIEKALRDADANPYDIDQVVLVGGATKMQPLRALVSRMFRRMPSANIDPDLVVAMGTAIQAGLKEKNTDLDDVVLTDVCPYSMGVNIVNEADKSGKQGTLFYPIIERNVTVPVSIEKPLFTASDNQTELSIGIYQGESRLTKNNIYLGEITVKVPKGPAGQESANVRYSYDMNGLLEVDVEVVSTGEKYHKTIVNAANSLSDEDIETSKKKLQKLKFHPRDTEENRLLIARAERLYEGALSEQREYLSRLITDFEQVLDKQNASDITAAAKKMDEILKDLEQGSVFT